MINGAKPNVEDIVQTSYNDWLELLKHTNNTHFLEDPFNIWIEAFAVGSVLTRHSILQDLQVHVQMLVPEEHDAQAKLTVEEVKQVQIKLLQLVMGIVSQTTHQ